MKSFGKLMGMLLLLLIAGNGSLNAQHGMRGMMDTTRMNRPGTDFRQMRGMGHGTDSLRMREMRKGSDSMHMRGMRPGMGMRPSAKLGMRGMGQYGMRGHMWQGPMYGMRGNYWMAPMYGMRGMGMEPMAMDRMGRGQMGPGRIIDNIPNLTDKQKKDIADLRLKQQDEMKKMRDSNRTKILNLLTDEQKKFVESKTGSTNTAPAKAK
jgi:hypothetical protein